MKKNRAITYYNIYILRGLRRRCRPFTMGGREVFIIILLLYFGVLGVHRHRRAALQQHEWYAR